MRKVSTSFQMNRPLFYGYADGKNIHAYTKEEWGIGAPYQSGNYATHNIVVLIIAAIITIPAALCSALVTLVLLVNLSIAFIIPLFFTLLFGVGVIISGSSIRKEFIARKIRKERGLSKPWMAANDEEARRWFISHPSPSVPVTTEYFPDAKW